MRRTKTCSRHRGAATIEGDCGPAGESCITIGTGNVFWDLGLPHADLRKQALDETLDAGSIEAYRKRTRELIASRERSGD